MQCDLHRSHISPLLVEAFKFRLFIFTPMELPVKTHGQCVAAGNCSMYCTSFKMSVPPLDYCAFCLHDISQHKVIGVMCNGIFSLIKDSTESPSVGSEGLMMSVPSVAKKERLKIYTPHIAGKVYQLYILSSYDVHR